jgi:hypothetical protein
MRNHMEDQENKSIIPLPLASEIPRFLWSRTDGGGHPVRAPNDGAFLSSVKVKVKVKSDSIRSLCSCQPRRPRGTELSNLASLVPTG